MAPAQHRPCSPIMTMFGSLPLGALLWLGGCGTDDAVQHTEVITEEPPAIAATVTDAGESDFVDPGKKIYDKDQLGHWKEAKAFFDNTFCKVWTDKVSESAFKEFVAALYKVGAKEVIFADIQETGNKMLSDFMVVQLPDDDGKREAVFTVFNTFAGKHYSDQSAKEERQEFIQLMVGD